LLQQILELVATDDEIIFCCNNCKHYEIVVSGKGIYHNKKTKNKKQSRYLYKTQKHQVLHQGYME